MGLPDPTTEVRIKILLGDYKPSKGRVATLGDCLYFRRDLRAVCRNRKCRNSTWLSTWDLARRLGLDKPLGELKVRCRSCKKIGVVQAIKAEDLAH